MDKDRLINLLPEEFLPEPEFKAFPIFAAALIILTVLFLYLSWQKDDNAVRNLRSQYNSIHADNQRRIEGTMEFLDVQATARFIRSYVAVVPNLVLQAPDYWEIYNEIERVLPDDTWLESMAFRPGGRAWPEIVATFYSKGYSFDGPLETFDSLKGTEEHPTRFKNVRMAGYTRTSYGGYPVAYYQIQMEIRLPGETLRSAPPPEESQGAGGSQDETEVQQDE